MILIIGLFMIFISFALGTILSNEQLEKDTRVIFFGFLLTIGILLIVVGTVKMISVNALEGKNMYRKDYIYTELNDTTMIMIDSTYTFIKE